jgi:hypothetical protein
MKAWLQITNPKDLLLGLGIEHTEEILERLELGRTICGQTQLFLRLPEAEKQVIEVTKPPSGLHADLVRLVAARNRSAGPKLV